MENFAPGLREIILSLAEALRVVVYFVCVSRLALIDAHPGGAERLSWLAT